MKFTHHNPTVIEFGEGQIQSIIGHITKEQKVLVVYGGGSMKKNGVYEQVASALEGYTWFEFGGVEPNPTIETMDKAVALVREKNIDFVLAVGGGSVVDGCKYLVAAALYEGDAWDFLDGSKQIEKALPLGVILTLPATGSESNSAAVVSKKATNEKRFFYSPLVFPKFAVLDPSTMSTLSDRQLANGLVDAFVHTCEQYITYKTPNIVQEGFSETLLKGLVDLANTWENRQDKTWQTNLMWIANQALNGLVGAGMPQDWSSHMIGHELTAFYGIDHARSLAIVQPQLLRVMFEDKKDKLKQMGENVFAIENDSEAVIRAIENVYEKVGMSTNLNDYTKDENLIDKISTALNAHGMTQMGENENITVEHASKILSMSRR